MAVKQTAGRNALGEFAPKFAQLNDDVLFGEVWSREDKLSLRDRSLVTVVALMAQGLVDSSFKYHLTTAKKNGITKAEIAEILTHAAFYAGWPKAWAAFYMAKEVWTEERDGDEADPADKGGFVVEKTLLHRLLGGPEHSQAGERFGQGVQTEQKNRSEQSVRPKTRNRQEPPRQRMCWQIPAPSRRYALSR